jgi:hypothetical protein
MMLRGQDRAVRLADKGQHLFEVIKVVVDGQDRQLHPNRPFGLFEALGSCDDRIASGKMFYLCSAALICQG